jgi:NDP-sugar pyrophosphorylase family protein
MPFPVAILAGGLATRLRPLTEEIPKILLDVAGKPFAEHQIELLRRNGVRKVVYCVAYRGEQVQAALGDGRRWGMEFRYVSDWPRLLGTGGALKHARALLGEAFFVLYGDSYLPCAYVPIEEAFRRSGKSGLMTVFRNDDQWDRSNVRFVGGRIVKYNKAVRSPDMCHIDYGLGILRGRALDRYPEGEALDLATIYQDLLAAEDLAGYEVAERFYEIGSPEGLRELSEYLGREREPVGDFPDAEAGVPPVS